MFWKRKLPHKGQQKLVTKRNSWAYLTEHQLREQIVKKKKKSSQAVICLQLPFFVFCFDILFGHIREPGLFVVAHKLPSLGFSKIPVAYKSLFPWSGMEPVSPALQGGFLTSGPPGKSPVQLSFDSLTIPTDDTSDLWVALVTGWEWGCLRMFWYLESALVQ